MPQYYRLNINGGYNSNTEVWSTSFAITPSGSDSPVTQAQIDAWAEAAHQALGAVGGWAQQIRNGVGTPNEFRNVRIYGYPDVGSPSNLIGQSVGAAFTGSGSVVAPLTTAMTLSLLTGIPGRSNRGRMYWPAVSRSVSSSGKFTGIVTATAEAYRDMLEALAALYPGPSSALPAVESRKNGTTTPVVRLAIGDVPDTQRRRRDTLVEAYVSAAL